MEPKCHVVKVCAGPNFMHSDCLLLIVYNNEVKINVLLERTQMIVCMATVTDLVNSLAH